MKYFGIFRQSADELKNVRCLTVTGLLIAVSMVIESFTINLGFVKINFAFLAIAAIGMLYGPLVSLFAGGICDIVGVLVAPTGGFFIVYTLIAMVQGLIYGLIGYHKTVKQSGKRYPKAVVLRLWAARTVDVLLINLVCNTAANYHYGFLGDKTLSAAIRLRALKNLAELPFDFALIALILAAVLQAYQTVFGKKKLSA